MVSLMVILLSTECFLFVYVYIDLLKLKAYKLFEKNVMLTSPGFFFKEANVYTLEIALLTLSWKTKQKKKMGGDMVFLNADNRLKAKISTQVSLRLLRRANLGRYFLQMR